MKFTSVLLLFGVTLILFSACSNHTEKPNIILVMSDDQGWGDMGYYGHPVLKTPNFDKMAAEGLRFDRFYAAAPVCSPTRGSVLTGRHPNRFGCFTWGNSLRPQEITLAEVLKEAGYVTGHFGKWHLGSVVKESPVSPGNSGFDEWVSAPNFFDNNPILSRNGKAESFSGESSMVTVDATIDFIQNNENNENPFFAVVWFGSPHLPYEAAEEDKNLYPDQDEKMQNYYGEITGMDRAFGKLRNELQKLSISENTILFYCSDNGGYKEVSNSGGREYKSSIYEGGLRVPALLEWPAKIKKHHITNIPANTSDIFPSILEMAGIPVPGQRELDGVSLVENILNNTENRDKPMGFWQYPGKGIRTPSKPWMEEMMDAQTTGKPYGEEVHLRLEAEKILKVYPTDSLPGHAAWTDWPWKLHRINTEKLVKYELYNLETDSMETQDILTQHAERAETMKSELNRWMVSVTNSLNGEDY